MATSATFGILTLLEQSIIDPLSKKFVMALRLLIVDDSPSTRHGLQALLSTIRIKTLDKSFLTIEVVGMAANGQEAIYLLDTCRPDVVLMDVQMPMMDGIEATKLIKRKRPSTRIILLTIHAQYKEKGLAAGANAFLLKGGSLQKLVQAIFNNSTVKL